MVKLSTWNICLGLKNKKDLVIETLRREKIDICCLQEVDIEANYPKEILSSKDYKLECGDNEKKSRAGIYVNNNIDYVRKTDLEGVNNGLVIIDFKSLKNYRLINLYRVFNPQNGRTQTENFLNQLQLIKNAITQDSSKNVILTGDFNLDDSKKFSIDYQNHNLYNHLVEILEPLGLVQLIDFPTWERITVNGVKNSILDHLYVKDCTLISNITSLKPNFGDHLLLTFCLQGIEPSDEVILKRNWQNYSKELLINNLKDMYFSNQISSVQSMWNTFENELRPIMVK